jgi:hypothetical protein
MCVEHNTVWMRSGSLEIATLRTPWKIFGATRRRGPVKLAAPQGAIAADRPKLPLIVTNISTRLYLHRRPTPAALTSRSRIRLCFLYAPIKSKIF